MEQLSMVESTYQTLFSIISLNSKPLQVQDDHKTQVILQCLFFILMISG